MSSECQATLRLNYLRATIVQPSPCINLDFRMNLHHDQLVKMRYAFEEKLSVINIRKSLWVKVHSHYGESQKQVRLLLQHLQETRHPRPNASRYLPLQLLIIS